MSRFIMGVTKCCDLSMDPMCVEMGVAKSFQPETHASPRRRSSCLAARMVISSGCGRAPNKSGSQNASDAVPGQRPKLKPQMVGFDPTKKDIHDISLKECYALVLCCFTLYILHVLIFVQFVLFCL